MRGLTIKCGTTMQHMIETMHSREEVPQGIALVKPDRFTNAWWRPCIQERRCLMETLVKPDKSTVKMRRKLRRPAS